MIKVLKDFYRIFVKKYGTKDDSVIQENKKRIEEIIEFNKDYSNKSRIICGIVEFFIMYIITFAILIIYFMNFNNIYNWSMENGLIGLFLFVFSLGIPGGMFYELFRMMYDNFINFIAIKCEKEKVIKMFIPICILSFVISFVLYMVLFFIAFKILI